MRNIGKFVVASLLFATLPSHAIDFDSSYTSIKSTDCTTVTSDEMDSIIQSCPAFGDMEVEAIEGDLR